MLAIGCVWIISLVRLNRCFLELREDAFTNVDANVSVLRFCVKLAPLSVQPAGTQVDFAAAFAPVDGKQCSDVVLHGDQSRW